MKKIKKKTSRIFQFKVALKNIKPLIWRRIQVEDTCTFWDLHVAIQDSMGWTDSHLHHFEILNPESDRKEEIGIPDEDEISGKILAGWKKKIADYFTENNDLAEYIYDYGDDWEHVVKLEKILEHAEGAMYPVCIDGERTCPPEDCGGIWGYEEFLEAIIDPAHERHEELLEWVGGDFDPEHFEIKDIHFDNPKKRLKFMLNN
ncbi:plasmid pRiA4b ORF-3-like protein [bacterium BMS3Bbin09]|nr:plasmid pRiA4b ORF-3-like protein [bacterium BMS3Bbin09]